MTDRLETAVIGIALMVGLIATPFALAFGNMVHDSRSETYIDQARTRHPVSATAIESTAEGPHTDTSTVLAKWTANGIERTGRIAPGRSVNDGDLVDIWIDHTGHQVAAPTPVWQAEFDAVRAIVVTWICGAAVLVGSTCSIRLLLDRIRGQGWDRDIARLVGDSDGHSASRP